MVKGTTATFLGPSHSAEPVENKVKIKTAIIKSELFPVILLNLKTCTPSSIEL